LGTIANDIRPENENKQKSREPGTSGSPNTDEDAKNAHIICTEVEVFTIEGLAFQIAALHSHIVELPQNDPLTNVFVIDHLSTLLNSSYWEKDQDHHYYCTEIKLSIFPEYAKNITRAFGDSSGFEAQ